MNVKVNSKRTRVSAPVRRTQASAQKQADAKQRVHELIERRARDAEYFRKCEAEVRLLHNWSKNRYLHRSLRHLNASDAPFELGPPTQDAKTTKCKRSASVGDLRNAMQNPSLFTLNAQQVPYDVQLELVRDHKLSDRRRQQWTKHVQALKRVVIEHEKTRRKGRPVQQAQDELVEHCRLLRQLRQQWDVRLQLTRSKLERLDLIRLSRDRLRQRAFLLAQMQSLGLALVDQLQQLGRCSARTGQQVLADTVSKASTKGKSSEGKRNVSDEKKEKQKRCRSGRETKSESQIALDQGDANEVQSDGEKTDADQKMSSQMSFESQQIQLEQILMNAQQMLKRYSRISLRRNAEYSRLFRLVQNRIKLIGRNSF